mgnify:CR=1 FL=1
MKYKYLDHTADIKFQAFGNSLEEVFSNSAYAMIKVICKERVKEKITKKIKLKGIDKKSLLYNFLDELLFLLNTKNFILSNVKEIKIKNNKLTATLVGDDLKNYKSGLDVKSVTYNDMIINEKPFMIQVVLDI